jgi:hypothetical protein
LQYLRGATAAADIEKFYVEAMLAEDSRFMGNPNRWRYMSSAASPAAIEPSPLNTARQKQSSNRSKNTAS